jgi:hypothetical protein
MDLLVGHAEVFVAVHAQPIELNERAGIDEQLDPLSRRQLALGVLCFDPLFAAARVGLFIERGEPCAHLCAQLLVAQHCGILVRHAVVPLEAGSVAGPLACQRALFLLVCVARDAHTRFTPTHRGMP